MRHARDLDDLFTGNGREKLMPFCPMPGTRPLPMTRAQVRAAGQRFNVKGESVHSGEGGTLWAVIAYCAHNKLDYVVQYTAGSGGQYMVARL